MKTLVCIPLFGLVLASVSCRTEMPIDPMTMDPSTRCLPDQPGYVPVEPTK